MVQQQQQNKVCERVTEYWMCFGETDNFETEFDLIIFIAENKWLLIFY